VAQSQWIYRLLRSDRMLPPLQTGQDSQAAELEYLASDRASTRLKQSGLVNSPAETYSWCSHRRAWNG